MKIAQILPEFHEGGVERHVLWLSNALVELGHEVTVISAGGKLEEKLDSKVSFLRLPVQKKNPAKALYSAIRIAIRAKHEGWDILHAHSRVPAWISWWTASMVGLPWVVTAHACYSLNFGLKSYKKADGVICVSEAVRKHLDGYLPEYSYVISNGLPYAKEKWRVKSFSENPKFLFVGRLTRLKGLDVVIEALAKIPCSEWSLDVVGDGPQREDLEKQVLNLDLKKRIFFHGFRDDVREWMGRAGCLLFPSVEEGMGLSFLEAVQIGLPVIASDLEPVRQMAFRNAVLVKPGDEKEWEKALKRALIEGVSSGTFDQSRIPTIQTMAVNINNLYIKLIRL